MHFRDLHISIELLAGEKLRPTQELRLKSHTDIIFEPLKEVEVHHNTTTSGNKILKIHLRIRTTKNEKARLKKIRRQIDAYSRALRRVFGGGIDTKITWGIGDKIDLSWERGPRSKRKMIERIHREDEQESTRK